MPEKRAVAGDHGVLPELTPIEGGYRVKLSDDGRHHIDVLLMIFNCWVAATPVDLPLSIDRAWCYFGRRARHDRVHWATCEPVAQLGERGLRVVQVTLRGLDHVRGSHLQAIDLGAWDGAAEEPLREPVKHVLIQVAQFLDPVGPARPQERVVKSVEPISRHYRDQPVRCDHPVQGVEEP